MADQSAFCAPRVLRNEIVVEGTYPKASGYTSSIEMARAAQTAIQGEATKEIANFVFPDAASLLLNQDIALATPAFGVQVTIGGSALNFVKGIYQVTLQDGATPLASFYLYCSEAYAQFILLGISNNGGIALLRRIAVPTLRVVAAGSNNFIGESVVVESLNARDLSIFGL
jgi:hypothetical protein